MTEIKRWTVDVLIGEAHGRTYAEASLRTDVGDQLTGRGAAQLHPDDRDVPEIGDELAVARALNDLGHRLLVTTADDIEQVTNREVTLTQ
jgi:Rv2632c-like